MVYLHQVEFDLNQDQLNELHIGSTLERVLAYLKVLLPNDDGFISADAYTSVFPEDHVHVLVTSLWETLEDAVAHGKSMLNEASILTEFEPVVELHDMRVHIYQGVE